MPDSSNDHRDQIYSDLCFIKTSLEEECDFFSSLRKKYKSFRQKISTAYQRDESFLDDLVDK
jgi:hypothetical protein